VPHHDELYSEQHVLGKRSKNGFSDKLLSSRPTLGHTQVAKEEKIIRVKVEGRKNYGITNPDVVRFAKRFRRYWERAAPCVMYPALPPKLVVQEIWQALRGRGRVEEGGG
jgi:hypothetical protein